MHRNLPLFSSALASIFCEFSLEGSGLDVINMRLCGVFSRNFFMKLSFLFRRRWSACPDTWEMMFHAEYRKWATFPQGACPCHKSKWLQSWRRSDYVALDKPEHTLIFKSLVCNIRAKQCDSKAIQIFPHPSHKHTPTKWREWHRLGGTELWLSVMVPFNESDGLWGSYHDIAILRP